MWVKKKKGKGAMIFHRLALLECFYLLVAVMAGAEGAVEEKAEAAGMNVSSPREGNMTFVDGITWCVAIPTVSQLDLQNALDWACGFGKADCSPIQSGGPCFNPNTLVSHASYAFNYYYQQNGNSDVACNFGATATLVKADPSYGKCLYAGPGSTKSSATLTSSFFTWGGLTTGILLLFFFHFVLEIMHGLIGVA